MFNFYSIYADLTPNQANSQNSYPKDSKCRFVQLFNDMGINNRSTYIFIRPLHSTKPQDMVKLSVSNILGCRRLGLCTVQWSHSVYVLYFSVDVNDNLVRMFVNK